MTGQETHLSIWLILQHEKISLTDESAGEDEGEPDQGVKPLGEEDGQTVLLREPDKNLSRKTVG